ncbi:MAG: flavin reductase family protein [Alistipes sp.]|nr:flavin reductase family protein [Alistipes sp.]
MAHRELPLEKAFTLLEPGPVTMVTTALRGKANVMTITWHSVLDFTPRFALVTGPWNYSYGALKQTGECVIAIPTVELMKKVIGVGTTTGADTDKLDRFKLTASSASYVQAPLITDCYANIECRVTDHIAAHDIFVLQGLRAWIETGRLEKRIFHYRGDGTFVADGEEFHHRGLMKSKLAPGI